jgi:hypothetical protein
MATHNIDLEYRPRGPQAEIHKLLGQKRFGIAVCHRRLGKTVAARMELIHRGLEKKKFEGAYIAPYLSQARRVFWGPLKETCMKIPGVECKETEMLVIFPNGSTIRCLGADNADGIRGQGYDFVVLDEYADFESSVLPMVIMPTLAGRNGGMFILGTPKGSDPLSVMYDSKLNDPNWVCFKYSAEDTGILSREELEIMKSAMTEQQYQLELCCNFNVGSPGQLFSGELVEEAMSRDYPAEVYRDQPRIMACDIARQGDDKTAIARRQGLQVWDIEAFHSDDLMVTARRIKEAYHGFKPDALFIDGGGVGAGVVDALRDMGVDVIEIQFGSKASDNRFINLRAQMYFDLFHFLRRGGRLPRDVDLKSELTALNHFTNDRGQTQLESKEDMRKRGMKSPDRADATALLHAMPVTSSYKGSEGSGKAKDDWDGWA